MALKLLQFGIKFFTPLHLQHRKKGATKGNIIIVTHMKVLHYLNPQYKLLNLIKQFNGTWHRIWLICILDAPLNWIPSRYLF